MDFTLSREQRLIVETVRSFVENELYPHEEDVERLDEIPAGLASAIRGKALAAGLYAANMPAELGGGGLDALSVVLVERELGRASYALQMLVERPSNVLLACEGEQRERYLLPAIRGERHDCVAMTEPEAGSDVRSMTTRAVRDGSDYVISGTSRRIPAAEAARWGLVNRIVPAAELRTAARGLADAICSAAPLAVAAVLEILRETEGADVRTGYSLLRSGNLPAYHRMLGSRDAREGALAFAERRVPRWTGE